MSPVLQDRTLPLSILKELYDHTSDIVQALKGSLVASKEKQKKGNFIKQFYLIIYKLKRYQTYRRFDTSSTSSIFSFYE